MDVVSSSSRCSNTVFKHLIGASCSLGLINHLVSLLLRCMDVSFCHLGEGLSPEVDFIQAMSKGREICLAVVLTCFIIYASDLDVGSIMEEARTRWLRPNEIHAMLCNYKYFPINVKPVNLPKSNYHLTVTSYLNSGCIVSILHCRVLSYRY